MLVKIVIFTAVAALCHADPTIIRPCKLNDLKCIRDNLAANSKCNPKLKSKMSPSFVVPKYRFDAPYFNSTYIEKNLTISNLHKCVVTEFFFNVPKDVAVLSLDCPNLDFEADRTLIQHYTMKEDTSYTYHYKGTYPMVRLTTNMKRADKINICKSYTYTEVPALPFFHVDPKDKRSANFLTRDLTLLNIYEIETFFFRGRQLFRDFINQNICDFKCPYEYSDDY